MNKLAENIDETNKNEINKLQRFFEKFPEYNHPAEYDEEDEYWGQKLLELLHDIETKAINESNNITK